MWCDKIDDEIVERKAWDLAVADGCEDPERMTYENDGASRTHMAPCGRTTSTTR